MIPAQNKRYYSVKEASRLLGVSTNTIYTYLKEGQLKARRIGKGRIKITAASILPYIEDVAPVAAISTQDFSVPENSTPITNTIVPTQAATEVTVSVKPVALPSQKDSIENSEISEPIVANSNNIIPGKNDIFFYRILKGISFLGLGIIYLLTAKNIFVLTNSSYQELNQLLTLFLPYSLIGVGLFNLLEVLYPEYFGKAHFLVDLLTVIVLSYFSYVAITTGNYGRFVIGSSFAIVLVSHLIQGKGDAYKHNYFDAFSKFMLAVSLIGGLVLLVFPGAFPFDLLANLIVDHKGTFAFIWVILLVAPLIYYISNWGKDSKNASIYFIFRAITGMVMGTQLLLTSYWDMSYVFFLMSIFCLFTAWWQGNKTVLNAEKTYFLVLVFMWISASLVFGNMALRTTQQNLISKERIELTQNLQQVITKLNTYLESQNADLTSYAGNPDLKVSVMSDETEKAISIAKDVYDKTDNAEKVVVLNKEGKAVAAYPRDTITQGANLSSRLYFQKTKESFKGYISPIYINLNSRPTVMHTEPIFENNEFVGIIGISINLEKLYSTYKSQIGPDTDIYAIDDNGNIVFSEDSSYIGKKAIDTKYFTTFDPEEFISNQQFINGPRWRIYTVTPIVKLLDRESDTNIFLAIILIINSIISIAVGIFVAANKKINFENNSGVVASGGPNPQFN